MKINDSLYKIFRPLLSFLVKVLFWIKIENKEVLDDGAVLIVANHRSFIDPIFILSSTKRTVHFFAKIELFKGWRKLIFNKTGVIPVDRSTKNPETFPIAAKYLKENALVGIFPEATRNYSPDKLLPLKPGAAKIAIDNQVPIVLAIQSGKIRLFNRNLRLKYSDKIYLKDMTIDEGMEIIKTEMEKLIDDRG